MMPILDIIDNDDPLSRLKTARITVRGAVITLLVSSEMEHYRARTAETKEPETLEWIQRTLGPHDVLWDVGANIGLYSIFAGVLNPGVPVVAIEPVAHNVARLCENVRANPVAAVQIVSSAISDVDGPASMFLSDLAPGSSMHSLDQDRNLRAFGATVALTCTVPAITLDSLDEARAVPSAAHLKIDVDGAELRVLKGATRLLANRRLRSVLLEVNWTDEGSADEVLNLMSKAGFAETERGRVWKCGAMSWQNVIFFRN